MTEPGDSFLPENTGGNSPGPFLFPEDEMQDLHAVAPDMSKKEYTGRNFLRNHPRAAEIVLNLLGVMSARTVVRLAKIHPATVKALADEFPEKVEASKNRLANLAGRVGLMSLEAAEEQLMQPGALGKTSLKDKMLVAAMAIDKKQLLDGEATSRIEVTERDYRPAYMQALDAKTGPAPYATHRPPEIMAAKAIEAGSLADDPQADEPSAQASDTQSDADGTLPPETTASAANDV